MKKGFTLIELLAVIVILAIIAIIATPIILDIIDDSKKSAATESAKLYTSGLQTKIATMNLENEFNPSVCTIANGAVSCDGVTISYELNGEKPTSGTINFANGVLSSYSLCVSGFRVEKNGNNVTTTKDATCSGATPVYSTPGLYRNGTLAYTWQELIDEEIIIIDDNYEFDGETYKAVTTNLENPPQLDGYLYIDDSIEVIAPTAFLGECAEEACFGVGLTGVTIPEGVVVIGDGSFVGNSLGNVTLPSTVTIISDSAFSEAGVTSVNIPDGVTYIGEFAFSDNSLTSITIPENLTSLEYGVFYNNQITSITIPANISSIGYEVLHKNPLSSITVDPNNTVYDSRNNCNAIIETSTNTLIQGSSSTVIPNTVTTIDSVAFSGVGLTSITIPSSVTIIRNHAFINNPLTSITVDSNNSVYDSRNNCNAIIETSTNMLIQGSSSAVIPNTVTKIGEYAFQGLGLTTLPTIPSNITVIEEGVFSDNQLTSITIPANITTIKSNAFSFNQLASLYIPATALSVSSGAFTNNPLTSITVDPNHPYYDSRNNCNAIINTARNELYQGSRNTVIPNTVTRILNRAFFGVGLTSITIPSSVTYIEFYAFKDNQLTSLTIPSSVTHIDGGAFSGNPITSLTVEGVDWRTFGTPSKTFTSEELSGPLGIKKLVTLGWGFERMSDS